MAAASGCKDRVLAAFKCMVRTCIAIGNLQH